MTPHPLIFLFSFLLFPSLRPSPQQDDYVRMSGHAQGTTYAITCRKTPHAPAIREIDSVLAVIDRSMSLWKDGSLINRFNASARSSRMDTHMAHVVRRALQVAKASSGAFDITVKPLVDAWGFGVKGSTATMPADDELKNILACVGSHQLRIKGHALIKRSPCTQIDLNGIAQGYSVDVLADLLESRGIKDYLVELGGEIRVRGSGPSGEPWTIGVEAAVKDKDDEAGLSAKIRPGSGGITTAGDYRKYVEHGGQRFSHVMDPRTGRPVNNGIVSVTVLASTAMDADAWDDALMVLGLDSSFALLASHPELEAHFIYVDRSGVVRDTASAGFFRTRKP